jgi:protein-L-isoaspartate O-methyltransferase
MLITTSFHIKQQKFSNSIKLTIMYDAVLILAVDKILPCILASQLRHPGSPSLPWKHSVDSSKVASKTQLFETI